MKALKSLHLSKIRVGGSKVTCGFVVEPLDKKNKLRVELKGKVCLRGAPDLDVSEVPNLALAIKNVIIAYSCLVPA